MRSSTMSPSGFVIARVVNPLPGAVKAPCDMPAPKSSALAEVVVTAPLEGVVLVPLFEEVPSTGLEVAIPEYSVARTSA